ncbi:MAG TPA: hypothetical protein VGO90_17180 [Chthoniobacteraceae bacterium]|nr:hypothetical protein [Chthoniobacteraceae bacterium]
MQAHHFGLGDLDQPRAIFCRRFVPSFAADKINRSRAIHPFADNRAHHLS